MTQPIIAPSAIAATRFAEASLDVAKLDLESARASATLSAAQAYFDAALADQLFAIGEATLGQVTTTFDHAKLAKDLGRQSEFELLRAQVEVENQRVTVAQLRRGREQAYLQLAIALDVPEGTSIQLTSPLDAEALPDIGSVAQTVAGVHDSSTRLAVTRAEKSVRMSKDNVWMVRSQALPTLSASLDYQKVRYPDDPWIFDQPDAFGEGDHVGVGDIPPLPDEMYDELHAWHTNFYVGATLTVPLFGFGRAFGDNLTARSGVRQAEAGLELTEQGAVADSRDAQLALETAQAQWDATAGTVAVAQRAYDIGSVRFNEGVSDAVGALRRAHPPATGARQPGTGRAGSPARADPSGTPPCPSSDLSLIEATMQSHLLLLLLAACGSDASTEKPAEEAAVILLPEDVTVAHVEAIATGPRISGTLTAAEMAVLRAEAAGSVVSVDAELGEHVQKGTQLAKIESQVASSAYVSTQSAVASASQDVTNANREVERVKRLAEAGALSPHDVENAEAALAAADARLAGAKAQEAQMGEQVGNTTVRSPIVGIVSQRAVSLGDIVAPGAPLFTVIEPSTLRLEGAVPAASATSLAIGTPVRFQVQGFAGKPFEGKIERIAPSVDPATRQIPILVSIPNPEGRLLAGLFAEGRVATEQHDGLVVPAGAVDTTGLRPSVLRVKDNVVERVEIELGIQDAEGEVMEVKSGLQDGDTLVMQGKGDVKAGSRIEFRDANQTTPAAADASASAER